MHQETDNLAEDVLNEFLQSNPAGYSAAPMIISNNEDDLLILNDDLTNFNFIQEFDLNNPTCTLPMNDHNILDSYMDQSKLNLESSSSKNPVYLDFNLNTNTFIKHKEDVKKNLPPVVSGLKNQKENKTNFTNRVVERNSTPIKKTVIPDFFNSRKPITTVYRKPLHTKTSYKNSLIEKEKLIENEVENLFKSIDTKDIKVPVIDDFPRPKRMRKQKFQNLLYLDFSMEFEDSSPKIDQPISLIKLKKVTKKTKIYEVRDSTSDDGSDDDIVLSDLLKNKSQKCQFCDKFFKTTRSLNNHKKICEKIKKIPEKRKLLKPEVTQPKKRMRKTIIDELPKLSNDLRCDICNKNFRQKSYLVAHLKTHENSKKA